MNIYVIIVIPLAILAAIATIVYALKTHRDPGGVHAENIKDSAPNRYPRR